MNLAETLDPYLDRFDALEKRERIFLLSLVVFLGALVLYFAIWSPIHDYYQSSLAKRDTQFSLIQYMRASEKQARAASGTTTSRLPGQSLITDVSNSAQQLGIQPNRIQPEGSTAVSVWFDNVVFNDLIGWIVRLNENQGIMVEQISIDRQDTPGVVNARVVLSG
jgi:general secretion pathway protein M